MATPPMTAQRAQGGRPEQADADAVAGADRPADWLSVPEVGTLWGLRFVLALCNLLGRRAALAFASLLALFYASTRARVRRVSRAYLRRLGLPTGFGQVVAHVRCFAHTVVDRVFFVQDRFEAFEIHRHGQDHLERQIATGRGALLLGAHIGSFEVMRSLSGQTRIPINAVGDFSNAERINTVLRRLNPNVNARLISVGDGNFNSVLEVREAIDRGELVAILADWVGHGPSVPVEFLGGSTLMPAGPFRLASALKCPVYFVCSLYRDPNRYDLFCEPFAERVELPRRTRAQALAQYAQRYADRLAHYCQQAPLNWFNFYDYWPEPAQDRSE